MKIAYLLYPDFTALDLFWSLRGDQPLAGRGGPLRCTVARTGSLRSRPDGDSDRHPGHPAEPRSHRGAWEREPRTGAKRRDFDWLRTAAPRCKWTASVCTGAGLYAAAGLLEGKKTTTHWGFRDNVRALGVEVVADRVVWQGTHVSGAGVSAGIDMALSLTERVHGRELAKSLQLVIEYDPQPPFDSGSPTKADASTLRLALRALLGDRPLRMATRMNRHALAARLARARRALPDRLPNTGSR